ncbi:MAG: transposase [Erysipelotrichaceae bacterium]
MKYYDTLVDYPKDNHKVTVKEADSGKTYVRLEIDRKYNPEKKYNVPQRVTIGVLDENDSTKMHPSEKYKIYFPDEKIDEDNEELKRSQCLRIGGYSLIKKMFNDTKLNDVINPLFKEKSGLIKDFVSYEIIEESNVMQHFKDYEYNHPLFNENMHIYSDSSVSDLLSKSISEEDINTFISAWTRINNSKGKIYISYDSTNSNCQAMDINLCEMGHAKLNPTKPIINLSIAFDEDNKIPLFYELYSGSIPDISCIETMIHKAKGYGFNDACFILDRGYFSKNNIRNIVKLGYDFLIVAKNKEGFIDELIDKSGMSFKTNRKNRVNGENIYGTTYKADLFGLNKESYVHVFFNAGKYPSILQNTENDIAMHADRLNKLKFEKIDEDYKDPYHELITDKDNVLIAFKENDKAIC